MTSRHLKIVFGTILGTLVFLLIAVSSIPIYYYLHPSRTKEILARYISQAVRSTVTIEGLSFSIIPMYIELRGLSILPGKGQKGFSLKAPVIKVYLHIEGRPGHRVLHIRNITADRVKSSFSTDLIFPSLSPSTPPSPLAEKILSFILFHKVILDRAEISSSSLISNTSNGTIKADGIGLTIHKNTIDMKCHINVMVKDNDWDMKARGSLISKTILKEMDRGKGNDHASTGLTLFTIHSSSPDNDKNIIPWHIAININNGDLDLKKGGNRLHCRIGGKTDIYPGQRQIEIKDTIILLKKTSLDLERLKGALGYKPEIRGAKRIDLGKIRACLSYALLDLEKKEFCCKKARIDSSLLKNVSLDIKTNREKTTIVLKGSHIHLVKAISSMNILPKEWTISGDESLYLRCLISPDSPWYFSGNLHFLKTSFSNRDETIAGDGLDLNSTFRGRFYPGRSVLRLYLKTQIPQGEILYDPFYVDLTSNHFSAKGYVSLNLSQKKFILSRVKIGLKDVISVTGKGYVSRQDFSIGINFPPFAARPFFLMGLREPMGDMFPILNEIDVSGMLSGTVRLKKYRHTLSVLGRCRMNDMTVKVKNISIRNLNADLPFSLLPGIEHNEKITSNPLRSDNITKEIHLVKGSSGNRVDTSGGKASFEISFPPWIPGQKISVPLIAYQNGFKTRSPVKINVPGGMVTIEPVEIKGLFSPSGAEIKTGLSILINDTTPLLKDIFPHAAKGKIFGNVEPLYIKNGTLRGSGKVTAEVFDGKIVFSDIHAILGEPPLFGFRAEIKGLNLREMTEGTPFGQIDGILNGYINGLEIANGQPQAFDLFLETEEREGIDQRISIRAIDNIARIGGGHSPFIGLAAIIAKVFKTLPYSRIGIKASLRNDVFRINGTIKEDDTEYLVKRGSLFGVNIVNQNPDNRIGFRDMLDRLKRISSKTE